MNYRVVVTPRAKFNLMTIHSNMLSHAPRMAEAWLDRAERTIDSLEGSPQRCPLAPEAFSFGKPICQLLFGSGNRGTYRLLFEITDRTVYVLHVRHGSRLPLSSSESET